MGSERDHADQSPTTQTALAALDEFELELRLLRLKRVEAAMSDQHERLVERLLAFPNPAAGDQYREVAANLAEVERHIGEIEFQLIELRWNRS